MSLATFAGLALAISGGGMIASVIVLRTRLKRYPKTWAEVGKPSMSHYEVSQMRKLSEFILRQGYEEVPDTPVRIAAAYLRYFLAAGPWLLALWLVLYGLRLVGWIP
jgi:hypothetical protein